MTTANATPFSEERFKKLIAFLIAMVTVFITVVTYLQNDASSRDDAANRDTKRYSLEALERRVSGDARVNFDYNQAYQAYYEYELLIASAEAEGDDAAMARYQALQERMLSLSPLLREPYFNAETGETDIGRYEADTYLVETVALGERFTAASAVKDAWDSKANTYIVHLTLLAVTLFLFGMATTISGNVTRWIFTGVGLVVTLFAMGWVMVVFTAPVSDLRNCKLASGTAIDAYAQGVGLAYQDKNEEAIAAFDQALVCEPKYISALLERGRAQASLGNLEAAAGDYEKARAAGDQSANVAGELAWTYYLLGRFDDAIALNRAALALQPDELWIRFDQGLALLAAGKADDAEKEYQTGLGSAARQVAEAQAAGAEPPSWLWWGLEDAAEGLDDLQTVLESGSGQPEPAKISDPDAVIAAAEMLITRLKSMSVALEYIGKPPQGELTASISPLEFAEVIYDENGEPLEYQTTDTFPAGIDEVSVLFDYEGMSDGQDVVFKVYIDGEEDPSWRLIAPWELGASGSAEKPISLAYSNTSVLAPGEYTVEIYVDSHFAQRGWFIVEEE
jgi:tetratricopeptide (TPR) repeat protein